MAESFARRMMAQRLMTDARATPFSDSAGFGGRSTPDSLIRAVPDAVDASLANEAADLGRVAYGGAAMGSLFLPGAGVTDVFGYAPDPFNQGEYLPSFGENVAQGNYLDAGLQTLGVAGDVLQAGGAIVPPLAAVGTALKAPRATRVAAQRLTPEVTRFIARNSGRNPKKVARDLRQEGLLDVNDRDQSAAFYEEFDRIKALQKERDAAKPRRDSLEAKKQYRGQEARRLKLQNSARQSPIFDDWTKTNRDRVLDSTYDRSTLDAEARLATVEAIAREARKRGLEVYYTSKGQQGRAGSRYIGLPSGDRVRISDHELPDTPRREYNQSMGVGVYDKNIVVSQWGTTSLDEYFKQILAEE